MSHPLGPDPSPSDWWQVRCTVADDVVDAEVVADVLWRHGAAGVEERSDGEGTVLLAGFPTEAAATAAATALRAAGREPTIAPVLDDGLDAWRAHAHPVTAGSFTLVPAWLAPPADVSGRSLVRLDPGRTFGSGSHPTTRLVVADLERLVSPGDRVLDVGCGSGVLSVVAARLGASRVEAIDVDPAAPEVTAANAVRNGVDAQVRASDVPLAEVAARVASGQAPFEVVAANLLAPIIAALAPDLRTVLSPTGDLVVSGILTDRWEATAAALAPLAVADRHDEDGWTALVLRHRTDAGSVVG